jgi:rhodanese-related sulfurtransferase
MTLQNFDPVDVAHRLSENEIVLVDVRELGEYAAERIQGALLYPLSTFDPHSLPAENDKLIVFHCGSGMRSAKAVAACEAAGFRHNSHMKGGIQAWKAAGLPTATSNPVTGAPRE